MDKVKAIMIVIPNLETREREAGNDDGSICLDRTVREAGLPLDVKVMMVTY